MASTRISKTFSGNGNRQKFTLSMWMKRSNTGQAFVFTTGSYGSTSMQQWFFDNDGTLGLYTYNSSGSQLSRLVTTRKFRDTTAWMHIVFRIDTTQSTAADRMRIYVNGVQETSFVHSDYISQNENYIYSESITAQYFGQRADQGNTSSFEGMMSHIHMCDGYSYAASSFGETDATTGEWKIITEPSVTYGTNGYWILKDGNTVTDSSPNSNDFAVTGTLSKTEDNPSNNFNIFNFNFQTRHLSDNGSVAGFLQSGGNTFNSATNGNYGFKAGTIGVTSGKYYWEAKVIDNGRMYMGVCYPNLLQTIAQPFYDETLYIAVSINNSGDIYGRYTGSAIDSSASGVTFANNDILGFALDMDNKGLYLHKNGTYVLSGDPTSGGSLTGSIVEPLTGTKEQYLGSGDLVAPMVGDPSSSGTHHAHFNFGNGYFGDTAIASAGTNASGNGIFEYNVPTGYTALCTKGLN